jgi:hypothetical protein
MRRYLVLAVVLLGIAVSSTFAAQSGKAAQLSQLAAPATPYPRVLASIPVAEGEDAELRDFRFDDREHRFYVTDRDNRLTVLQSDTFDEVTTLPVGGDLWLDERNQRLYVYPGDYFRQEGAATAITVIDTRELSIAGTLPDATYVSVDPVYGRIFTGVSYSSYIPDNTTPIRIYDAVTLSETAVISATGIPVYNPMRRDLVVLAYRAYTVDPTTGVETVDLLPEQTAAPFEFCNGCDAPVAAHVFPEYNLLVIRMTRIATGGGGGLPPAPRYFDATTLREIPADEVDLMYQTTCGSQPVLTPPIDGRLYQNQSYLRYVFVQNWVVSDTAGDRVALRDGTYANFVNPATRQAIIDQGYVVDLATLLPIGRFPAFCWFGYDAASGRFFGHADGNLLVMADTGGAPEPLQPPVAAELPSSAIAQIVPSPSLPDDGTLFISTYADGVLRSGDGGETWVQLQGGLPYTEDLILTLAISPNFSGDRTIFAGGDVPMYRGEGILKSVDGGETWTPLWRGLDYLRVQQLAASPDYAEDAQVFAQVEYTELQPWEDGAAIYASDDGGLNWSLAMSTTGGTTDAPFVDFWSELTQAQQLPVRLQGFAADLEVAQEDGVTWRGVDLGLADNDYLYEVAAAPDYPADPAIYVRSRLALFRTEDEGQTWERWDDPRLVGRDFSNDLSALAVGRSGPGHVVFIGTTNGEVWRVAGDDLTMTPIAVAVLPEASPTPTPPPTPVPTATPIPATPAPLSAEPPAGLFRPRGPLATSWEADADLQARIGWAITEDPAPINMAQQVFATGMMLWREDIRSIYVLSDDGRWTLHPDTFVEGEPESDPSLSPPAGYLQPIRGFGKVWRENADVRERLGWARSREGSVVGMIQEFERGVLIGAGVRNFALIEETSTSGVWK